MNHAETMKIAKDAEMMLTGTLSAVQGIVLRDILREESLPDQQIDFLINVEHGGERYRLLCEVKSNGQPRHVRNAIFQLKHAASQYELEVLPVIIAPYLSNQSQELCRSESCGYMDFVGNTFLEFGSVHIDHKTDKTPKNEQRSLRSIFKPKAAHILRQLLNDPERRWRIADLAAAASASAGHVSEVGQALREREWAEQSKDGLYLINPDALLDTWAEKYERPAGERVNLYTHLHGSELANGIRLIMATYPSPKIAFGSYSAADWIAPFARTGKTYLYADERGLGALQTRLELQQPHKGANIEICVPDEDGVLDDAIQLETSLICTSPVQTYLDLMISGERGREAAQFLREAKLQW